MTLFSSGSNSISYKLKFLRVYVDVVLNHMTSEWYMPVGTAGSTANPGNKEYPAVPYRPVDFHDTCSVLNYGDADEIRKCEFLGLKDLDQVKF